MRDRSALADALLTDKELAAGASEATGQGAPSLEDGLLGSWPRPFGWIVVAEPVADGQAGELISQVSPAQLDTQRHDSPLCHSRRSATDDETRRTGDYAPASRR